MNGDVCFGGREHGITVQDSIQELSDIDRPQWKVTAHNAAVIEHILDELIHASGRFGDAVQELPPLGVKLIGILT